MIKGGIPGFEAGIGRRLKEPECFLHKTMVGLTTLVLAFYR